MKHKILFTILLAALLFIKTPAVLADYGQYGGTVTPQTILIDKFVSKPYTTTKGGTSTIEYVDNLTPSDPRFKAGAEVMFKLVVKNTSTITINNVTVKDFVPGYVEPIEGPGNYDSNSRTITFNAGDFAANEEKVYYLKMQLVPQANMPADKGLFCLTNKAQAYNDNASDEDTAQFCIEKEVIGVKKAPAAGPEMGIALAGAQMALIGLGIGLKKKSK